MIKWLQITVDDIEAEIAKARELGQHSFIWDTDGQVPVYFENFGRHKEFTNELVTVALSSDNETE